MIKKITKRWFKAAAVRALKTVAQTFIATIGSATVMGDVNWQMVLSATVLAGILSLATSLAGIPEVPEVPEDDKGIYHG